MDKLPRKILLSLAAVAIISLVSLLGWKIHETRNASRLINEFTAAQSLPTLPKEKPTGWEPPKWRNEIHLNNGLQVRIEGFGFVGGEVVAIYGDDNKSRLVAHPGDYVYPSEIRIDPSRQRLYVLANGFAAGIWKETRLYEFDLVKRKQISFSHINLSDVRKKAN